MEIQLIQYGHPLWEKTITYAETCSWKAGPVLAERMLKNDFLDWERIAVAVDQESVAGFCAFLEKDELPESYELFAVHRVCVCGREVSRETFIRPDD